MEKKAEASVFRNGTYMRLFFAQFTNQMGSVIGIIAVAFFLLDRFSQQPYYATITEMMYSIPSLCVFFIVGVLADRMDRQKIAVYCDWIRLFLTLLLLAAIQVEVMPLVFAILFLRSAIGKFFDPAQVGLVQGVLSKEQYTTAAAYNQMTMSLFLLFGNGLGAACYWLVGVEGAILVDAFSFLVSGLLIASCKIKAETRLPNGPTKWSELKMSVVWSDFKKGSLYILQNRLLFALMLGLFFLGILNGSLSVMPIFILKYKLAPESYGAMMAALSIAFGGGFLTGSAVAKAFVSKVKSYQMIIGACMAAGLMIILEGLVTQGWLFIGLYFVFAFTLPFINVPYFGLYNRIVDPKMMGRVQGWHSPVIQSSHSLILGFIALAYPAWVQVEVLFFIVGAALLSLSVYYMFALPHLVRKQEQEERMQAGALQESAVGAQS